MKIKKMIAVLLVGVMTLSFVACGEKKSDEKDTTLAPGQTAKETLIMATNATFPPYEYYDGSYIVGIDAEIAALLAEELGMELKIEDMEFDSIIPAIQSGKAQMGMAGMTASEDRKKNVNFSTSYTKAKQVIIVKEDSTIDGPDALEGKKVGVQLGTTGDMYAEDIKDASVERYNKGFEAVLALSQNKIDAVVIDSEPAKEFVKQSEGLKIVDKEFTNEEYAIAVSKDNTELLDKLNTALEKLKSEGKVDEIINKYIKSE